MFIGKLKWKKNWQKDARKKRLKEELENKQNSKEEKDSVSKKQSVRPGIWEKKFEREMQLKKHDTSSEDTLVQSH